MIITYPIFDYHVHICNHHFSLSKKFLSDSECAQKGHKPRVIMSHFPKMVTMKSADWNDSAKEYIYSYFCQKWACTRKKSNYELLATFELSFFDFLWAKQNLTFKKVYCSVYTKKLHNISFIKEMFWFSLKFFWGVKIDFKASCFDYFD